MYQQILLETAHSLLANDKGLLAIDESPPTCNQRFAKLGIAETASNRLAWRELIITTPKLAECISGLIVCDETIRQHLEDNTPVVQAVTQAGMLAGIKVDIGSKALAGHDGEQITEGLDGLRERLQAYAALGARFAKWRAVISIAEHLPSLAAIEAQAHALARYAALCQAVTETVLRQVFQQLSSQGVILEGMLLKPNMVLPGLSCPRQAGLAEVAVATLGCLARSVPAAVPGIAFLSGGQTAQLATARLQAINSHTPAVRPWALSFSFARAIQQPALDVWLGRQENSHAAQQVLLHRARYNQAARRQEYYPEMETNAEDFF